MRELRCARVLIAPDAQVGGPHALRFEGERIAALEAMPAGGKRLFAMPALTNSHDHARMLPTTSYGAFGKPLESWVFYLALLPSVDP